MQFSKYVKVSPFPFYCRSRHSLSPSSFTATCCVHFIDFLSSSSGETKETVAKQADFIVGADGAHSAVRRQIITTPGFDYSQTFIEHGYLELSIPATDGGESAMPAQYLHIWPRGDFMMIALPNKDCSWTVTLFMPLTKFKSLISASDVVSFFKEFFPDYVKLIGDERLAKMFFSGKPQPLVMVKVNYQI